MQIGNVYNFMRACDQTLERFDTRQVALYTGLQCEELAEKIEAILGRDSYPAQALQALGHGFKVGDFDSTVALASRKQMLDADIDLAWVCFGAAHSMGADAREGWRLVNAANMAKVDPVTGRALRDANGKIKKPAGWASPDLSGCVDEPTSVEGAHGF